MTDPAKPPLAPRRIETLDALPPQTAHDVLELIERAAAEDGQPAVSEQGRLNLRGGQRPGIRHLLLYVGEQLTGYAQLEESDPVEAPAAELVIEPGARGRGHGRALGHALLELSGKRLRVWAHGGHAAARHLAAQLGLALFRELRQMRRPLPGETPLPEPVLPPGVTLRTFRPGEDDAAWLAVNAAAFAHHPEQGSLTQRDLDDRKAETWFDPAGFFLAVRGEQVVGFHWTKVHAAEELGEVYVLGVAPGEQGTGLGKALTAAGLRHLAYERKMPTAMLYVDADNVPAVTVYERLGFTVHEVDLMYRTET
ncbi:mycothiol synthase [Streptantibioticus ferralitis]|uniref:Mycothiol acetyltransferase n=1 Tax=Streptantibioticus ferralitis TaxID=236510 RepID=A0ABT5Z664_9ACTN|nr:mycothiol synthase [Streptantibioticus ferralitis]MDF2259316.1 mycothiol synthase [Streptantibioticus ferralitis]